MTRLANYFGINIHQYKYAFPFSFFARNLIVYNFHLNFDTFRHVINKTCFKFLFILISLFNIEIRNALLCNCTIMCKYTKCRSMERKWSLHMKEKRNTRAIGSRDGDVAHSSRTTCSYWYSFHVLCSCSPAPWHAMSLIITRSLARY